MSLWIEKRKRWRLREELPNGERVTIERDLGIWRDPADQARRDYKSALSHGFVRDPKSRSAVADARAFLRAKEEGREVSKFGKPMPVQEMLDIYVTKHGPSLKGGIDESSYSNYYKFKNKVEVLKNAWTGRASDSITSLDVRDFLARYQNVGCVMKYLRLITHAFNAVAEWNEEGIFNPPVKIPAKNPGKLWRKKMKAEEKRELPDTRVLSEDEWAHFSPFLSPRAFRICDLALRRFLSKSDIRKLSDLNQQGDMIKGARQKTGVRYSVPATDAQFAAYDFTNFQNDFWYAQEKAEMRHPIGHPLHFSLRSLRRTGATWAYRKTKDIEGIRRMLGHRNIATTIRYLGLDESDLLAIAEAVDKMARGLHPPKPAALPNIGVRQGA